MHYKFDALISSLRERGMAIPFHARGAFQDIPCSTASLRLYVVTWDLSTSGKSSEWSLLLILTPQPEANLPLGIRMQIADDCQVLTEQVFNQATLDNSLYARMIGSWREQFHVTIILPNHVKLTLPPFTFDPNPDL